MPSIFKALASTVAWAGFIGGWVMMVITIVNSIVGGQMWNPAAEGTWQLLGWAALAVVALTLSVVVMRLRQKME